MQSRNNAVLSLLVGAACAGIGVLGARIVEADSGDMLAFAGALIGAAAAVWGAFAVADRAENRKKREGRQLLLDIVTLVQSDVEFMIEVSEHNFGGKSTIEISDRLDRISIGIGETLKFISNNNLAGAVADVDALRVEMQLRSALATAEPHFAANAAVRARRTATMDELADVSIGMRPRVLVALRSALQSALKGLE